MESASLAAPPAARPERKLQRDVGFVGLLFASVGSIIGSGWLFGALSASAIAGPVGNPAAEIISAAEARGVELIVVGRRGQHKGERFLMGSVSDRVVRHAPCDVLVVR
jgi:hypothetical protein